MFKFDLKPKSFFGGASQDFVSIESNSGLLRISHSRKTGKRKEIINVYSQKITGLADDEVASVIRNFLQQYKIKEARILLTIPPNLVVTRNIEVPSQDPSEIKDIMDLQAARYSPYAREEITIDYIVIGVYRKSYTKILLAIVTKEVVKKQLEILKKINLYPERVLLSSEAIAKFCVKPFKLYDIDYPIGVIYIDNAFSYFNIILRDTTIFLRSIPVGREQISAEHERYAAKFVEEIKNSLEVYKNESIENIPQRIILLEDSEIFSRLAMILTEVLELPVNPSPITNYLSFADESSKQIFKKDATVLLNSAITSLEADNMVIDFTPEETKLQRVFEQKSKDVIKTGILSVAVFVLIFTAFASKLAFKAVYLQELKNKAKPLRQQSQTLEDKFRQVQKIKKYLFLKGFPLEVLDKIYTFIPDNTYITELKLDRKTNVLSIKGTADLMTSIFTFVEDLDGVAYFEDVKTKYTTKRKEDDKDVADFELVVKLSESLDND